MDNLIGICNGVSDLKNIFENLNDCENETFDF